LKFVQKFLVPVLSFPTFFACADFDLSQYAAF
jgi:hypothetical protein